jgi:iron complex transport system permease protein
MFRNPLVEPYTLGISGGAALGVCINIVLKLSRSFGIYFYPVSGFIGSLAVILLIYFLSIRKGIIKIQGLLLTGVMTSFICSSFIMLILATAKAEDLSGIVYWTMGSLSEISWPLIQIALVISILALIVSYFFSLDLNALALGEDEAIHIGINVERSKRALFFMVCVLVGLSVSIGGIIGFVGLIVPHFMRLVTGSDHRILLAGAFLTGAAFLILCDTIARVIISPVELPVGVITGILGGSFFIYASIRKRTPV